MGTMMNTPDYPFSARVASLKSSAIREILRVVARPGVISFAGGLPAPELFPSEVLASLARDLLASRDGPAALQYAETEGTPACARPSSACRSPPDLR
jgi:2-aminoadipate transaminase